MIPVTCDHRNSGEVGELFKRISMEQNDQLDIVVSNAFSAVSVQIFIVILYAFNVFFQTVAASKTKKFFELPIDFFDWYALI